MKSTAPFEPMEALLVEELPSAEGWQYEPKWDGFRCVGVRSGTDVQLWSKSGKPLGRYFPELEAMFGGMNAKRFVLDGEVVIELGQTLSFEALQSRLHPAESRVRRLAAETPARFIAFDCLSRGATSLLGQPLRRRRAELEALLAGENEPSLLLSPVTMKLADASAWLERSGGALDGVIAKRLDLAYRPGERAMLKVKVKRTADCVVGGFRLDKAGARVASLLLGLYDDEGLLHHVGFTSSIAAEDRDGWTAELNALAGGSGFTGKAPGGPSRWTSGRSHEYESLRPQIVVEVLYDQITGDRFRHGTKLLRRRSDKAPRQCTMEQLRHPLTPAEVAQLMGG